MIVRIKEESIVNLYLQPVIWYVFVYVIGLSHKNKNSFEDLPVDNMSEYTLFFLVNSIFRLSEP